MRVRALPLLILPLLIPFSATASDTVAGTIPATPADLPIMQWAGIPNPVVGMLWNQNDPNSGRAAGEAKMWLSQHATRSANVSCLNADFAQKLQQLMMSIPGGPPTITDAYRSPQQQANLPRGSTQVGPCGSYHQYGLAADFNEASPSVQMQLRVNAAQFGLTTVTDTVRGNANPQTGCTVKGFCDGGHIQIQGPKPSINQCGVCGSDGMGSLAAAPTTGQTPTSGLTNLLRSYLGGNQQPGGGTSSGGSAGSSGAIPGGSGISTNPGIVSAPTGSTAASTTGNSYTAVPANITNAYTPEPTNVSDSIGVPAASDSGTTSSFYLLQQLAGVTTTSVTIATGTPLALNSNLTQVGTTYDPQNNSATAVLQPGTLANSVSLSPAGNQQTFTSPDLQYSGGTYQPPQNTTMQQRVLENLKLALLKLLEVIRPFGYVRPMTTESLE